MARGLKRDKVLAICGLSKNKFYYEPKGGKRGRKPSTHTLQQENGVVIRRSNQFVKDYMKSLFDNPLIDYGYHRMTGALQLAGFYINHKKVYRLMKAARLLRRVQATHLKSYVKYRIVCPPGPLRLMEMDIKQVWVEGLRRYVYVLTILDVFTRFELHWEVGFGMKQQQVHSAWEQVIEGYLEPEGMRAWEIHIEVRSDNGPQFCAQKLRQFMQDNYFVQTFTHPYTPQENGHIESFHAIFANALRGEYFGDLPAVRQWLDRFYQHYNYERIHGSTCNLPPMTFWTQWKAGNVERVFISEKERKVRFLLKVPRQQIQQVRPAGNESPREVLSLIFEGSIPEKIKMNTSGLPATPALQSQTDGAVLNAQPAV